MGGTLLLGAAISTPGELAIVACLPAGQRDLVLDGAAVGERYANAAGPMLVISELLYRSLGNYAWELT